MLNLSLFKQQWKPYDTVTGTFTDAGFNEYVIEMRDICSYEKSVTDTCLQCDLGWLQLQKMSSLFSQWYCIQLRM